MIVKILIETILVKSVVTFVILLVTNTPFININSLNVMGLDNGLMGSNFIHLNQMLFIFV